MNIIFSQIVNQIKGLGDRIAQSQTILKRSLMVGLISLGLWTASVGSPAYAADANDYYSNERGSIQNTERYDQIQPNAGGMNGFDDADPRRNTRAAEAKAKTLKDSAVRRQLQTDGPLERAGEEINNVKNGLGDRADKAADSISNKANQVTNKVGDAVDSLGRKADRATDRLGNEADRATNRLGDEAAKGTNQVVKTTDKMNGRVPNQTR